MRVESTRLEMSTNEVCELQVVKAVGEVDVYTVPSFKSAISKIIEDGTKDLIIDLTDVSYMDSGGFGALLGATKRIKPLGGGVNLVGCSQAIDRMLKITRLNTIFNQFDTVDEAVASVKR